MAARPKTVRLKKTSYYRYLHVSHFYSCLPAGLQTVMEKVLLTHCKAVTSTVQSEQRFSVYLGRARGKQIDTAIRFMGASATPGIGRLGICTGGWLR